LGPIWIDGTQRCSLPGETAELLLLGQGLRAADLLSATGQSHPQHCNTVLGIQDVTAVAQTQPV